MGSFVNIAPAFLTRDLSFLQLHTLLVKHGRSCRSCSANGNITDPEVDSKNCPIKKYLKEARSRNKASKEEENGEELAGLLPKDIKDEEAGVDEN